MKRSTFSGRVLGLLLAVWTAALPAAAQTPPPGDTAAGPDGSTNSYLSAMAAPHRAPWQQRFTLGAGDVLNLELSGLPDTVRRGVPVGPDGRLTFLQAREVTAAGLTIDQLRARVDEALQTYYQNPRVIITPATYRSKRYFVLGAVNGKGVYSLDRPLTVIEALARAGGLETGLYAQRTVELADLPHSFLVRNQQRLAVDFERLFQRGDLSQNIPLEPDDYLYFASADSNEIYVLGEVIAPGSLVFEPKTTVIAAIAGRGGFNDKAFRQRVLVVRGSLNHPQTFVVNTAAILAGKEPDFKLESKDIVYVSVKPWAKAEELLFMATQVFIQSMTVQWTSMNMGPYITQPLLRFSP